MTTATTTTPGKVACEGCEFQMRAEIAVCPMCGHRREISEEDKAKAVADAMRVSFKMDAKTKAKQNAVGIGTGPYGQARSGLGALGSGLMPSPHTEGTSRVLDVVLSALVFPFLLSGILFVWVGVKRWGNLGAFTWAAMGFAGTFMSVGFCFQQLSHQQVFAVDLGFLALFALRGVLRFNAYRRIVSS